MKRILVVDDDAFTRGYLVEFLREAGYTVVEARDGGEGIRLFQQAPADLIILDLFMPRMNGLEALLRLDPKRSGIPVIVISGGPFPGASEPSLLSEALGAVTFLRKPFANEALLAAIEASTGAGRHAPEGPPQGR